MSHCASKTGGERDFPRSGKFWQCLSSNHIKTSTYWQLKDSKRDNLFQGLENNDGESGHFLRINDQLEGIHSINPPVPWNCCRLLSTYVRHMGCFQSRWTGEGKALFLDNMFHNIIFVGLKVSFNSKYLLQGSRILLLAVEAGGTEDGELAQGFQSFNCANSLQTMPCTLGSVHQIHDFENLSTGTYLVATFWKLYKVNFCVCVGGMRVWINCLVLFIQLMLLLCKVFAIMLQSQETSSKSPYFIFIINNILYFYSFKVKHVLERMNRNSY